MSKWVSVEEVLYTENPHVYASILWNSWSIADTSIPLKGASREANAAHIGDKSLSGTSGTREQAKKDAEQALRAYEEHKMMNNG